MKGVFNMTINELIYTLKDMKRACGGNTEVTISGLDGRGKYVKVDLTVDKIKITTTARGFFGFKRKYTVDMSIFGECDENEENE